MVNNSLILAVFKSDIFMKTICVSNIQHRINCIDKDKDYFKKAYYCVKQIVFPS